MGKAFQAMSNLDLFYLLQELSVLKGARLVKAYGFKPDSPSIFRFKFRTAGGEKNLQVGLGFGMWLTKYLKDAPRQPDAFVMKLRKDLVNAVLFEVKQIGLDRVVSLVFSSKVGNRVLVVEFVGNGNMLLLDDGGKIIQVVESRSYSVRKLRAGAKYVLPPSEKKNPRELAESDLRELRGSAVSALFKKVNLSPFYLEEACVRAGIGFDEKIEAVDAERRRALADACKRLFEEELAPRIYEENSKLVNFAPFELKKFVGRNARKCKNFSEALDAVFGGVETAFRMRRNAALMRLEKEADELRNLLRRQERAALAFESDALEKKAVGDWIKTNSGFINLLSDEAKAVKQGENAETVEKRLSVFDKKFKRVKLNGAEIVLELAED